MKRTLSLLLCLTLLFGLSGFPSAAADSLNVDSYYTLPESVTVDGVTITADGQLVVTDEKLLQVLGDINANISDYGTALSVMDGSTVDIGGSVLGNINPDTYTTAIEADSWSSEGVRPSYVRVGKNVQGDISAYGGSIVDIAGRVYGQVSASGDGTSVKIGDGVKYGSDNSPYYYISPAVIASDHATVSTTGDVVNKVKSIEDDYVRRAIGIAALNGGTITVDGNVSAINSDGSPGTAVQAIVIPHPWIEDEVLEGSTVEVTGDVQGQIYASGGSTVNVKGHTEGGIEAEGEGTSVSIGDYVQGYIYAYGGSTVDVKDHAEGGVNARGEGTSVFISDYVKGVIDVFNGSTVDVKGHTEGRIEASGNGTSVTIGDGVKYESDKSPYYYDNSAVNAYDHATISITGDVVSKVKAIEDEYVRRATAITARNGANVTIDGTVSAINSDGSLGTGIDAYSYFYPWNVEVPEGSTVEVTGDVQGQIRANYGSTVNVQGHAEGGVSAQDKGTSVTIGDYAKGYIDAFNGSSVDVHGHVDGNIYASGVGTHVTVGNGVSPRNMPSSIMPASYIPTVIHAYSGAKVDVTGDVDGSIQAYWDGKIDVIGNVSGLIDASQGGMVDVTGDAKRISISNPTVAHSISNAVNLGSTVRVGGDVSDGVFISMYSDGTDQSKVTVEGTISSERNAITLNVQPHVVMDIPYPTYPTKTANTDDAAYQKAMEEYRQSQEEYWAHERELIQQAREQMNTAEGVQTIIDNLPQIIVGTLAPEADFVLVNGMMNQNNQKKITEALLSQINYIVNMEGVDTANIAVYGYEELDGYLVAREQQKLTVKCINDNMVIATVSAGRYATIDTNADGSYTITVQRGGDLNLVVTARPKTPTVSMDRSDNSGTNSAYDEAQWSGWLSNLSADYAMGILTLDLTEVLTTDIPYETLRAYLADYGIDTLIVITENAEYTMSIAELLALAEDGATFTFSAREGALELAVNGTVVSTFSVE